MKKNLLLTISALLLAITAAGCATDNNHRTINELAHHMILQTDAKWDGPWVASPPGAESGFALRINDRQVVFLKYDNTRKKMLKKLESVDENEYLYIMTFKFPAMRNGSFVMVDYEAFPPETKEKLIRAFKSF